MQGFPVRAHANLTNATGCPAVTPNEYLIALGCTT